MLGAGPTIPSLCSQLNLFQEGELYTFHFCLILHSVSLFQLTYSLSMYMYVSNVFRVVVIFYGIMLIRDLFPARSSARDLWVFNCADSYK